MSGVPILVEGAGLRVLVVGAGSVAARKLAAFVAAGATVRVIAPQAVEEIRALADAGHLEWLPRTYAPADMEDATVVLVATDDRTVNAMVAADARSMDRMVNVADAPDDGTFTMMASHGVGPLVIGVSAGRVPGAAVRIRDVIAARFDERYARALRALADVRRVALDRGEAARWRALAHDVVDDRFCRTVEDGSLEERMSSWR